VMVEALRGYMQTGELPPLPGAVAVAEG